MQKLLTIIVSLICWNSAFAQLQVQVKDFDTKAPLPFATAECISKQWGTYSDSAGRITIKDSIWRSAPIKFSYVGYDTLNIVLNSSASEVSLHKKPNTLQNVVVSSCKEVSYRKVGRRNKRSNYNFGYSGLANGFMWASYITNTTRSEAKIEAIFFGVKKLYQKANPDAPVRLRMFELNNETGMPGDEITSRSILISPGRFGWVKQNIKEYDLYMPLHGVVIAFEMFDAGQQFHFTEVHKMSDGSRREMEHYGWILEGIIDNEITVFFKQPGRKWYKLITLGKFNAAPAVALELKVCGK